MKSIWTKKNVEAMNGPDLIKWNNSIVADLRKAEKLNVKMPASEKAIKLITAELQKRKMI